MLPKILVISGPTSSGKTALALKLARERNGEIVNADSRQVYRGMNIATGKEVSSEIAHHCFDLVNPDEDFSMSIWRDAAERAIADILLRGKLPILVGGTGLYLRALLENLEMPNVPPDPMLRAKLETRPLPDLLAELDSLDPATSGVIQRSNKRRVVRALEVVLKTGKSFTELGRKGEPKYDAEIIWLDPSMDGLRERITKRVDKMVEDGLVEEARELISKYNPELPSMSSIGYPEAFAHINKKITEAEMKAKIVSNTIAYAKRQKVFLRKIFTGKTAPVDKYEK
ncbi:MAG: tRNA (adenosine(37)-N6)-dimethylallyltransferase MiaA [bacterium]